MGLISEAMRWLAGWSWMQRVGINMLIKHFGFGKAGKVMHLKIERAAGTIEIVLELEGEATPVTVNVAGYKFETLPDGKGRFSAGDVKISKPWMEAIARNVIKGKTVEVPEQAAKWLKLVL